MLLQPLGHLSVSLESVVYRLVAEPETPLVIEIVIRLSISKDHLRLCACVAANGQRHAAHRSSIAAGHVGEGGQCVLASAALGVASAEDASIIEPPSPVRCSKSRDSEGPLGPSQGVQNLYFGRWPTSKVLLQIASREAPITHVWPPVDFLDLSNRDAIDKSLQRLVQAGQLRRIDRLPVQRAADQQPDETTGGRRLSPDH